MVEQRAVSARRWMFDSSPLHFQSLGQPAIMLRILLLAPGSNPNSITGPLIGYSHGEALARLHAVTLVIRRENEEAVHRKQPPFRAIEVVSLPWLDRTYAWSFRR